MLKVKVKLKLQSLNEAADELFVNFKFIEMKMSCLSLRLYCIPR